MVGGAFCLNVNNDEDNPTNFISAAGTVLRMPYPLCRSGIRRMAFGTSYDVNTSALKAASNSRGGVEISLIYVKKPVRS
jgi:hypothetical protein